MLTRRQFILEAGAALGAWLVGAEAAQRIIHLGREQRRPYLVEVEHPEAVLWANRDGDEYRLTLAVPESVGYEFEHITWEDWFRIRGVNYHDAKQLREHLVEFNYFRPEDEEPFVRPRLRDKVPPRLQEYYIENDLGPRHSPSGEAFHYLARFHLANNQPDASDPLGSLDFYDGLRPFDDSYLVVARNVETLGGLQQRLFELGQNVAIRLT